MNSFNGYIFSTEGLFRVRGGGSLGTANPRANAKGASTRPFTNDIRGKIVLHPIDYLSCKRMKTQRIQDFFLSYFTHHTDD